MQKSSEKAENALTLPQPQQVHVPEQGHILHLGPVKAYGPINREKICFVAL